MSAPTETTEAPHLPGSRRRSPAGPPRPPHRLRDRLHRALRHAGPALYAYICVRLLGLFVLSLWAHTQGHGLWPILATDWDSAWYLGIAEHGYARELGTAYDANNLAFFPLYPLLLKVAGTLLPGSTATAGLALAFLSSLAAAWGIFAVGAHVYGRRAGTYAVVLWAALPVGLVQWMAYTESLFTAFAAWSLYAVLRTHWLWAGALATLAGLTRPTGIALAAAVSLAALLALRRGVTWRPLTGAALAPLGWLAYVGWVGLRLDRWDGYFAVQRLWHNELDGGRETARRLRNLFFYDSTPELFLVMVSLTLLSALALFAWSALARQPLPLLIFTGLLLFITLTSGGVYFSRARFLLPAFPLLLPLAALLAHKSRRYAAGVLGAAALGAAYCSAYMVLVWPSAP